MACDQCCGYRTTVSIRWSLMPQRRYTAIMRIKSDQIGVAIFMIAVILTGLLIWLGVSGRGWPEWLLMATTIL